MTILADVLSSFDPHCCPAIGCDLMVPVERLVCNHHWNIVPLRMQKELENKWALLLEDKIEFPVYFKTRSKVVDYVNKRLLVIR